MVLLSPLFTVGFLLFTLWAVDRGEFLYEEEREEFLAGIVYEIIIMNTTELKIFPDDLVVNYDLPIPKSTLTKTMMPFKANTVIGILTEYDLYPKPKTMIAMEKTIKECDTSKLTPVGCLMVERGKMYQGKNTLQKADIIISSLAYTLNQISGAWASHIATVWLVGDFEFVGLLILYRKIYFEKIGFAWVDDLHMFNKRIKWQLRSQMLKQKAKKAKGLDKVQAYFNWFCGIT